MVGVEMNPHKQTIMDESSGVIVSNQRYLDWQEGYKQGQLDFEPEDHKIRREAIENHEPLSGENSRNGYW